MPLPLSAVCFCFFFFAATLTLLVPLARHRPSSLLHLERGAQARNQLAQFLHRPSSSPPSIWSREGNGCARLYADLARSPRGTVIDLIPPPRPSVSSVVQDIERENEAEEEEDADTPGSRMAAAMTVHVQEDRNGRPARHCPRYEERGRAQLGGENLVHLLNLPLMLCRVLLWG